jgi:hypothetical protein
MSTASVTLKDGATGFTVVGGTDQVFTPDGDEVANGVHLIASGVADFYERPSITIRTRSPKVVNGVAIKGKRWYTISQPRLDANGELYYDVMRCEEEIHPSTAAADAESFHNKGVHLLWVADLSAFRSTGSLG